MYLSQIAKCICLNCTIDYHLLYRWSLCSLNWRDRAGFLLRTGETPPWKLLLKIIDKLFGKLFWETFFGTGETSSLIIAAQNNLQIVLRLVSWSLIILKHFHQQHQLTSKSRLSANHAISLVFYPNKMSIKQQLFVRNWHNGQITLISISRLTHRVALQPGLHDWAPPGSWNIISLYI